MKNYNIVFRKTAEGQRVMTINNRSHNDIFQEAHCALTGAVLKPGTTIPAYDTIFVSDKDWYPLEHGVFNEKMPIIPFNWDNPDSLIPNLKKRIEEAQNKILEWGSQAWVRGCTLQSK